MASLENRMKEIVAQLQANPISIRNYIQSLFVDVDMNDGYQVLDVVSSEIKKFWDLVDELSEKDAFNGNELEDINNTFKRLETGIYDNGSSDQEREYAFNELASMVFMFQKAKEILAA